MMAEFGWSFNFQFSAERVGSTFGQAISSVHQEKSFELSFTQFSTDDGTSRVFIIGAHGASDLVLTVGNEVFEESEGILRGMSDCSQGLKMLGVMRTKKVLATGKTLTVVGEAVALDGRGNILIRQPDGGPFYVSHKTIDQLIAYLGKDSRWFKYASIGLAVLGVCILAMHTSVYFRKRMKNVERPKR